MKSPDLRRASSGKGAPRKNQARRNRQSCLKEVRLHCRFLYPEDDLNDSRRFLEFIEAARSIEKQWRSEALSKAHMVHKDVLQVFFSYLENKIGFEDACQKIFQLVPDKAVRLHFKDTLKLLGRLCGGKEDARRIVEEIDESIGWAHVSLHVSKAFEKLAEAAFAGSEVAIKLLVSKAIAWTEALESVSKMYPDVVRRVSRKHLHWPVLGSVEDGWSTLAKHRINTLELGSDFKSIRTRFHPARGADQTRPARVWAKAAVRTIEETRWRHWMVAFHKEAIMELVKIQPWELSEEPAWAKQAVKLPSFSRSSLPEWAPVIRAMIRAEIPDFHLRLEWKRQAFTAECSGRASRGEIQNAILDDILSALQRIAPKEELPNFSC